MRMTECDRCGNQGELGIESGAHVKIVRKPDKVPRLQWSFNICVNCLTDILKVLDGQAGEKL